MEISVREDTALLDKAVFHNIRIKGFTNMDELARRGNLEVNEKSSVRYITESGQEFTKLHIGGDGLIDRMVAGANLLNNSRIDYCTLDTSIKDTEAGNLSCYTVEEYASLLGKIQDRLICNYGIDADFSQIGLKELEINRTFRLDSDFENYHRALVVIMNNLPGTFKGQMEFMDKDGNFRETNTYYATTARSRKSERYMLFKIYNKTKSVEKVIVMTESYMRVEIRLVGSEKIKRSLGTNKFYELTDEVINQYFDAQIQKLIVKPYEKWKAGRDKYLVSVMRERIQVNEKHWKVDTLRVLQNEEIKRRCPVLLDISELIPLVNEVVADKKQRYKVKCTFRKQAEKIEDAFCNNDHLKLEEIMAKLAAKGLTKKATADSENPSI